MTSDSNCQHFPCRFRSAHTAMISTPTAPTGQHKRVQVCIRVRPPVVDTAPRGPASVVVNDRDNTISVVTNTASGSGTCFHFDQVLDRTTTQAGVFQAAAADIVDSVLSGYNGTIMAYGQTGAGKTYTMSGGKRTFEDRGICARAISGIFHQVQRDANHSYVVRVSYVEVYNENLYDLLNFNESNHLHPSHNNNREELVIQENEKGQTFVRGLSRPIVKTEEDAFDLLFQGETNRTIAEHCLNASSTRSHCIFTVYVERQVNADTDAEETSSRVALFSKLHLVDLAGSERMKKTHVSGVMLKEASHINKSLTFLEQVVIALGDKKRSHIPYRQTPLTNLLKDSLGGNCRTMLVACVWPEDSHNDQTLATLKFATRMMRVKTSAVVNVAGTGNGSGSVSKETQALLEKYVGEIKRLKEELAMHDTISGRSLVDYDLKSITSASAREKYREHIKEFIRDETRAPPIQNLAQIHELFVEFRTLYLDEAQTRARNGTSKDPPGAPTTVPLVQSKMVTQFRALRGTTPPPRQQEQEISQGLKLPRLERSSSAPTNNDTTDSVLVDRGNNQVGLPALHPTVPTKPTASIQEFSDKELFEQFRQMTNPKPESLLDLDVAKQNLRLAKSQASTLGVEVNKVKLNIDGFTMKLQEARALTASSSERPTDDPATLDPSTEFIILQLRDAKKQYREVFEQFQEKKAEVKYLLKIKEQMLLRVTREFEAWKTRELSESVHE